MRIVVNVDDVGLHPAIGRAVMILKEKGVVSSISLKGNEALDELDEGLLDMDVGVHLDILRGRPVSHWQHVSTLCDDFGSFYSNPAELFEKYAIGKVEHAHVEMEWRAQIEHVMDVGGQPTHLTSHKHLHGWPSLAGVASKLAREYGIGWIRKPIKCDEIAKLDRSAFPSRFRNVCTFFDRESEDVQWSDWLWVPEEIEDFSPVTFSESLAFQQGRIDIVEIACCPGIMVSGDQPVPHYANPTVTAHQWRTEFRSLAEDNWLETLRQHGHVTSYSEMG